MKKMVATLIGITALISLTACQNVNENQKQIKNSITIY